MIVLSLFDGISCGRLALARLRLPVTAYYASEIDPKAIAVAQANFPHTIQIRDVREASFANGLLRTKTQSFNIGHVDCRCFDPPSPHPRRFSFGNLCAEFPLGAWGEHWRQKGTFLKKLSF